MRKCFKLTGVLLMIVITGRTWIQVRTSFISDGGVACSCSQSNGLGRLDHQKDIMSTPFLSSSSIRHQPSVAPSRFLMGIFLTLKGRDRNLRVLIRRALQMYNDSRVCSFGAWNGQLTLTTLSHVGCELIYTFVVGANPQGPTQIVASKSSGQNRTVDTSSVHSLLAQRPEASDLIGTEHQYNDITFLNIRENMVEGKTPTWFHFASLIMATYGLDYAIKSDSDTYLRVDEFFDVSKTILPTNKEQGGASRIYAGRGHYCKLNQHMFMQGQFYLLTRDLAETVASTTSLVDINGTIRSEDRDLGHVLFVKSTPPLYMVELRDAKGNFPWLHPLKSAFAYHSYTKVDSLRLQMKNKTTTTTNNASSNNS